MQRLINYFNAIHLKIYQLFLGFTLNSLLFKEESLFNIEEAPKTIWEGISCRQCCVSMNDWFNYIIFQARSVRKCDFRSLKYPSVKSHISIFWWLQCVDRGQNKGPAELWMSVPSTKHNSAATRSRDILKASSSRKAFLSPLSIGRRSFRIWRFEFMIRPEQVLTSERDFFAARVAAFALHIWILISRWGKKNANGDFSRPAKINLRYWKSLRVLAHRCMNFMNVAVPRAFFAFRSEFKAIWKQRWLLRARNSVRK